MPEEFLEKIKPWVTRIDVMSFISTLVFGVIAHIYKLVNWLPNWDSLVFRHDPMNVAGLGRWLLSPICALSTYYDLPWINGLLSILLIGLGTVCVCRLFEVERAVTAVLLGGLTITFPAVTSLMAYNYTADGYSLAFFMAALGVLLIRRGGKKAVLGAALLGLSMGLYQAYISVAICLVLLYIAYCTVFKHESVDALKKAGVFLLAGVGAAVLYAAVQFALSRLLNLQLSSYQGVAEAFALSNINIPRSLLRSADSFVRFFLDFKDGVNAFSALNVIMFVFTAVLAVGAIVKNGVFRSPLRLIIAAASIALMPFGAVAPIFIQPDADCHSLMLMSYWIFPLMLVLLCEKTPIAALKGCERWAVFILSALMIYNNTLIANVAYHKMQIAFYKSYSVAVRVADRIEQTEGAAECEKIAVIGSPAEEGAWRSNFPPEMAGVSDSLIILETDAHIPEQNIFLSMLTDYCGLSYMSCTNEELETIKAASLADMRPWPSKASVKAVGDTLIIYFGD